MSVFGRERQEDPAARTGQRTQPFHARILSGQERSQWWPKLVQAYPPYGTMQAKTDRELPVVLLAHPA
jgi:F420H(2)-dependent quinone reductase